MNRRDAEDRRGYAEEEVSTLPDGQQGLTEIRAPIITSGL